jgi:phosphatidylglycerophosphate synthase
MLRGRRLVPDLLTLARPGLGIAAGVAVAVDAGALGGWLYLVAYLTDVADGLLARALGVSSESGRRLDGVCDLVSMYGIGLGLLARSVLDGAWAVVVLLAVATVGGDILDRTWLPAHTVLGKALGGITRVGALVLFVVFAEPSQRGPLLIGGAIVFGSTFVYEGVVTWDEMRSGERPVR